MSCHFPIGILGQVCYLFVSIPDPCTLTYYENLEVMVYYVSGWVIKKVKVNYLTWVVYESPHLVWMQQLISSRAHGACHYLPGDPV